MIVLVIARGSTRCSKLQMCSWCRRVTMLKETSAIICQEI